MSAGRGKRYAGPCMWCESCIDREGDICTLLYKEVAPYKGEKKKCVAYQPRRNDDENDKNE